LDLIELDGLSFKDKKNLAPFGFFCHIGISFFIHFQQSAKTWQIFGLNAGRPIG
jgi:hypothetical protein